VKDPKHRCRKKHHHETPATHSLSKTEPPTKPRVLDSHSRTLKQEVDRGETIAPASGQRDHEVVDQAGNREHQEASRVRAQPSMQRAENQLMRKLAETEVPTLSPKLPKGCGTEWRRHDGFCIADHALPEQRDELVSTDVTTQDVCQLCRPNVAQCCYVMMVSDG